MWVITFDLKSKEADKINAYGKIMNRMLKKHFEPIQRSVYASDRGVDNLHNAINAIKAIPGLSKCINDFRVLQMFDSGSDFSKIMKSA